MRYEIPPIGESIELSGPVRVIVQAGIRVGSPEPAPVHDPGTPLKQRPMAHWPRSEATCATCEKPFDRPKSPHASINCEACRKEAQKAKQAKWFARNRSRLPK